AVRDLEAVSGLMTFWDRTVACQDDLAGHGNLRTCAERINIDVQISAGGAHAGYPAQGPGIWGLNDVEHLRTNGTWGWFHELGHEAQRRPDKSWGYGNPYTFNGSTEATVNLFSTYARDTHGIRAPGGWGWTSYPDRVMKRAREAVDKGGYTKVDVGRKLAMFLQIRDGFGWQAWKQVLRSYNREAKEQPSELPKTDAAKRDQFLIRFSNVTGHNLTRFLRDFWKLDFSPGAIEQVRQLPDWMPAVGGIDRATVAAGDSFVLPLQEEALSLDGTARITAVGKPGHGQLKLTGEGKWSYTPIRGFEGDDTFSYTVSSSTGHTHTTDVTVAVRADGAWLDTWRGVPGVAIANLTGDKRYPDAPDQRTIVDSLEVSPTNLDNYGARLRALLVPPASGLYTFWIASDDAGALYLSNDDQPGGRRCIARVSGYTAKRAWDAAPEQKSAALKLERGRSYYLEALVKEGGGSDHLSVAWQGPDIERQVIPNSCLKLPPR
ncbi:MAG: cadherin-like domain-containing protein, partial [Lentisphaerae bacterium]|nr:cadherin-like domain-containing protein [Lentisphaerota bacterium]